MSVTIVLGDPDFHKTLSKTERVYIHEGCNFLSKGFRETKLKALHMIGYTLDQLLTLSKAEQDRIWRDASETWNKC